MRRVIKGNGIKLLDEQIEIASFKTLIGVYLHLVSVENPDDLNEILFVFKIYIYKKYEKLYSFLKKVGNHCETLDSVEYRLKVLKISIEEKRFMCPSEILNDLGQINKFEKIIHVQEVSFSCCIKLK